MRDVSLINVQGIERQIKQDFFDKNMHHKNITEEYIAYQWEEQWVKGLFWTQQLPRTYSGILGALRIADPPWKSPQARENQRVEAENRARPILEICNRYDLQYRTEVREGLNYETRDYRSTRYSFIIHISYNDSRLDSK